MQGLIPAQRLEQNTQLVSSMTPEDSATILVTGNVILVKVRVALVRFGQTDIALCEVIMLLVAVLTCATIGRDTALCGSGHHD